jgi:hypothetical protein
VTPGPDVTGAHTLRVEAARAGVSAGEYAARLERGLLWCYRCLDWHQAEAFPVDSRRHTGRAGSCTQAIRAAVRDALTAAGEFPVAAVWVVRRPGAGQGWVYWRGTSRPGAWSPEPDRDVARFPDADRAADAMIAAFGGAGAVPPGCRIVRLAVSTGASSVR